MLKRRKPLGGDLSGFQEAVAGGRHNHTEDVTP